MSLQEGNLLDFHHARLKSVVKLVILARHCLPSFHISSAAAAWDLSHTLRFGTAISAMVITLIGYRGTGKTTVGAALAQRLNWQFLDLDPEIEARAGMTISEMFQQKGEPYFRALESDALAVALSDEKTVISPGGGSVMDSGNRAVMQAAGPVVWLTADIATIAGRLASDPETLARRPSLTGTDVVNEIADVLNLRTPYYQQAATIVVATDHRTPAAIVDEITIQLAAAGIGP